jgi:hypothetical protein
VIRAHACDGGRHESVRVDVVELSGGGYVQR